MKKSSKNNKTTCKTCGKEFLTLSSQFCSTTCRNIDHTKQDSEKLQGIEGEDYVVCRWCGLKVKRMYGSHLKVHHPGKTTQDYKNEFPNTPLACSKDNKNVAKAYIKFTQSDEGRKFLSEKVKGEKNPNSRENTDDKTRKSRSPFSIEFYLKKGFTEEESRQKISEFATNMCSQRLTETQLEYWIQKTNGDVEQAKEFLRERQRTFTLEKCIAKYGEEDGRKRWIERHEKWKNSIYSGESCITVGTSKIFKEFLSNFQNVTPEFFIRTSDYCFIFDIRKGKKLIEFDGDFWHCNPKFYSSDFVHPIKKKTAQEIWDYDRIKEKIAKDNGYQVFHVWESDYRDNSDQVIEKCKQFLES